MRPKQPIIGTEREPAKLYKAGSYVLQQRPGGDHTLAEQDHVFEVLKLLGFTNLKELGDQTLVTYFNSLDQDGRIKDALELLLEFRDRTPIHRIMRTQWMKVRGITKRNVIEMMGRKTAAKVIADFFSLNFSSTQRSVASPLNTASS